MPLPLVDAGLRGMVLALALLLAALLAREQRRGPGPPPAAVQAALLLCLGLAVQVPGSAPWVERHLACAWQSPLIAISVSNAVLFWLFTAALFDDGFRWRAWHAGAWVLAALVGGVQCVAVFGLGPGPGLAALRVALRVTTLLCALGAIWVALRHWQTDLVEARRRLRLVLVAAGIVYTLVQLVARLSTPVGILTPELALLDMGVLLVVMGGWVLSVVRLSDLGLLVPTHAAITPAARAAPAMPTAITRATLAAEASSRAAAPSSAPVDDADPSSQALGQALQHAMAEDRAYRADDLTVASLAARLGVPEYRLRRHINQHLGFRNFNVYVNSFRLADARRWLADAAQGDAPVLTIALDAGFGSIGPFNRAFKADTGLTPTEFRARALAESFKA